MWTVLMCFSCMSSFRVQILKVLVSLTTLTPCQLRSEIVTDVILGGCKIVLLMPFSEFCSPKFSLYFHHQYVNIDCLYIKKKQWSH